MKNGGQPKLSESDLELVRGLIDWKQQAKVKIDDIDREIERLKDQKRKLKGEISYLTLKEIAKKFGCCSDTLRASLRDGYEFAKD